MSARPDSHPNSTLDAQAIAALQPIGILVCALGGEGGGVLTEWLVEASLRAGYPVQSTSIPGVAQRTGATTYYVEIFPWPKASLQGRRPVLSLYPVPGNLDVMVSSELLETVRQVSLGMASADRTHVISSVSRTLTTTERMHLADGRRDAKQLAEAVRLHSLKHQMFDMEQVARKHQTVVSAVMFGALSASGVLPFGREACELVMRDGSKNAERSLAGFDEAYRMVRGEAPRAVGAAPVAQAPLQMAPLGPQVHASLQHFPDGVREIADLGYRRLLEYQDQVYAELYRERLERLLACEAAADATGENRHRVCLETARYLALWMAFDDIVRVADLKARRSRALRVAREVKVKSGELLRVYDYFKPGLPELAGLLPEALAARLKNVDRRRRQRGQEPLAFPIRIASQSVFGLAALRFLASLRWLRRRGSRFAQEQQLMQGWLQAVEAGLHANWQLGYEIALCGRLIKGYGTTNERGKENLLHVIEHLAPGANADASADAAVKAEAIKRVREAALADDAGIAFDQALIARGAPPRPVKAQPIRFERKARAANSMASKEVSRH